MSPGRSLLVVSWLQTCCQSNLRSNNLSYFNDHCTCSIAPPAVHAGANAEKPCAVCSKLKFSCYCMQTGWKAGLASACWDKTKQHMSARCEKHQSNWLKLVFWVDCHFYIMFHSSAPCGCSYTLLSVECSVKQLSELSSEDRYQFYFLYTRVPNMAPLYETAATLLLIVARCRCTVKS